MSDGAILVGLVVVSLPFYSNESINKTTKKVVC